MDEQRRMGFHNWLGDEWLRCAAMLSSFEGHAITYLTTANGGGAAALIAFAGSAGYTGRWAYATLAAFLLGIVFAGATIAAGYYQLRFITRGLGADHKAFNMGEISSTAVDTNHQARFNRFDFGLLCAWLSATALLGGMTFGAIAYIQFPEFKAEKERTEAAKATKDPVVNVTCAPALMPQAKMK